jgi:hypothetical protein
MKCLLVYWGLVGGVLVGCVGDSPNVLGADAGLGDALVPDGAQGDGASYCWPYKPANYDPCTPTFDQDHPTTGQKTFSANAPLDTDAASDTIADGGVTYALYRYSSLTIAAGATLTIKGSRPALIIVDGDANVQGSIVVSPNSAAVSSACGPSLDVGPVTTNYTAGGGGGGYGGAGAGGGAANGNQKIGPLRMGCPGGASGTPKPVSNNSQAGANPAPGGAGGGALELSVRGSLTIANTSIVTANGAGGGGGDAHAKQSAPCLTMDMHGCNSGGGGGGSGGSILLEGVTVNVMGSVCAVGGGGGAGGNEAGVGGDPGTTSTTCTVALGGKNPVAGGNGGAAGPATAGANGGGGYVSNGGGGGGEGRIRIRASGTLVNMGTVVPAAYTQ